MKIYVVVNTLHGSMNDDVSVYVSAAFKIKEKAEAYCKKMGGMFDELNIHEIELDD